MNRLLAPLRFAHVLIAGSALLMGGCASMDAKDGRTQAAAASCPDAKAVRSADLYGNWQAAFAATPKRPASRADVTFTPHRETAGALSGRIVRPADSLLAAQTSVLAGGIGDGQFGIEESSDEVDITGLWNGDVVPGSCGREIRGTWIDPADDSERGFVLTRQPAR